MANSIQAGGGKKGSGGGIGGFFTRIWRGIFGGEEKGNVVAEELILTSWELDTEAIADFVSGGEVTNMRARIAIYQEEGLNSYLNQSIADAHREELLNFVAGGYGIASSLARGEATFLEGAILSNYNRFIRKIPANSKSSSTFQLLSDGNYLFQATIAWSSSRFKCIVSKMGKSARRDD